MFEFVIPGIPRTAQTKRATTRDEWKSTVSNAARNAIGDKFVFFDRGCSAVIVYFYSNSTELDVDGIAKLILDALKEVLYDDDKNVEQVLLRKSDQVGLVINNPTEVLAGALGTFENLVYVKFDEAPKHSEVP
jgi:crossover junction endodeoxyribonuclease RusA